MGPLRQDRRFAELMGRSRWFSGYAGVSIDVVCDGASHRLTWRSARLVVEDHDVPGELGLAALGGTPPRCIRILQAWRQLHHGLDPELLDGLEFALVGHTASPNGSPRTSHTQVAGELPAALRALAVLGTLVRAHRRWKSPGLVASDRRRLHHLLSSCAREAVETTLEPFRSYRHLDVLVECTVADPGEPPSLDLRLDDPQSRLDLRLPLWWLVTVSARGAAVIDGSLVLTAMARDEPDKLDIATCHWELRGWYRLEPVFGVQLAERDRAGRWHLAPSPVA